MSYSIVSVIAASMDSPSFCTPLFRNSQGERYFAQIVDSKTGKILNFQHLGEHPACACEIPFTPNTECNEGGDPLLAVRLPNGNIKCDKRSSINQFLAENFDEYSAWPFFQVQIAVRSRDKDFLKQLEGRYSRHLVPLVPDWLQDIHVLQEGKWTVTHIKTLASMSARGSSASEIAKALGKDFTRNSVISKLSRIRNHRVRDLDKYTDSRLERLISDMLFSLRTK